MKLSNISIIFIIIVLPIILLLSYYISLQVDTINMQTSYTSKQIEATREAIEAFEINTVEWNESYSTNADSKRRDVMASINTFTTGFANSIGVGGTNKENILTYIPAIAVTLYDGYYIYTPSETKEVIKDKNGLAVFWTEKLWNSGNVTANFSSSDYENYKGKLLYKCMAGETPNGTYYGESFTFDPSKAVSTYDHILKPYSTYSARYKKGNIDITVNYTLDTYITIYGTINGEYVVKSGYLIAPQDGLEMAHEYLREKIAWRPNGNEPYVCQEYSYVYAEDNTKVYFDGNTTFQVSSTGIRTNLSETTGVKYKKIRKSSEAVTYQALNTGYERSNTEEPILIEQGKLYTDKNGTPDENVHEVIGLTYDYSSRNYYIESTAFTKWVQENLADITIGDMKDVQDPSIYGQLGTAIFICADPEKEDSDINRHKREIIKQTLISDLNQSITSYSRHNAEEYKLPILTETDWDHVLRNVCIITFLQNIPIGMKYYNNYAIATSTANKEYVNVEEMYFIDSSPDIYYHLPYCSKMYDGIIGYKNIDYVVKSYEENDETKYYYKHSKNQACYYCIVQRDLYEKKTYNEEIIEYYKNVAIARERYRNLTEINLQKDLEYNIKVTLDPNEGTCDKSEIWVAYQGKYEELPEPTRDGWDFMGWYTDDLGDHITKTTTVTRTEDHTLVAHWYPKTYTVTFDANGGTPSLQNVPILYAARYWDYLPQEPTMTGHDFQGWFTQSSGGEKITEETTMESLGKAENHTLYAQWTPSEYTVTFNPNGGALSEDAEETITVKYGEQYGELPIPTKEGYNFMGWLEEPRGIELIRETTTVTTDRDHTLKAMWQKSQKVTLNANGGMLTYNGETNSIINIEMVAGTKYAAYLNDVTKTRDGYSFVGWYTAPEGGTKIELSMYITEDITLYAHWTPENYIISLNPNGGSLGTSTIQRAYESEYGLLPEPIRNGYIFDGWYTSASGGNKVTSSSRVTIAGRHTLYAHWVTAYTITYDANGGSGAPSAETKGHGIDWTLNSKAPTRDGYKFKGWATYSTATEAEYQPGETYTENRNVTLYAVWEQQVVPVAGVTLNKEEYQWISQGSSLILTATVSPSNATNKDVTWESSNSVVASVDPTGLVRAKSAGTATITVTTGNGKTDTVKVYVYNFSLNAGESVVANNIGTTTIYDHDGYNAQTVQILENNTITAKTGGAKFVVRNIGGVYNFYGAGSKYLYQIMHEDGNYTKSNSNGVCYFSDEVFN